MKILTQKSALLTLLLVGFVAFFAAGCGDRDDFVITGNVPNNNTGNGALVFNFQQAVLQAPDVVPAGTATLRFDFFTSNVPAANTFSFTENRQFAPQVIIDDVPANIQSVLVTAVSGANEPLATFLGSFTVIPGARVNVDLNDAQPVTATNLVVTPESVVLTVDETRALTFDATFTSGSTSQVVNLPGTLMEFLFSGPSASTAASVNSSGVVTGETAGQNATLTTSYAFGGATLQDTTEVRVVSFEADGGRVVSGGGIFIPLGRAVLSQNAGNGGNVGNSGSLGSKTILVGANKIDYLAQFRDSDGVTVLNFSNENDPATLAFSLVSGPSGTIVDPTTGDINVPAQGTGNVVVRVTWTDARTSSPLFTNRSFSDDITFTIGGNGGNAGNAGNAGTN